ncbi:MAG: ABC transporter permease, partial [Gammaproteobacteria bacterium]
MLLGSIEKLGRVTLGAIQRLGRGNIFLLQVLAGLTGMLRRPSLLIKQLYSVGVQTLIIIIV